MTEISAAAAIDRVGSYDPDAVEAVLRSQLSRLGCSSMFKNKRVVIKPNLVMKKPPESGATTHPAVLEAVIRILKESTSDIVIAESPGGLYLESTLRSVYRGCGIAEIAERYGVPLNYDTSSRVMEAPDGHSSKLFDIITPIADAEVIVNLAKLKSHSLTGYSGAVKNYFGTVPGVTKFEMHARFPDYGDFGSMLCDLCQMLTTSKPTFNIVDGILAMEGNGPTGGDPRQLECIISGTNPFAVDVAGSYIIGAEDVIMLSEGKKRGLCPKSISEVEVLGDEAPDAFIVPDFKRPDTSVKRGGSSLLAALPTMFGGHLNKWLQPRPVVDTKKCVGCGECEKSCPRHTVVIKTDKKGRKRAAILDSGCIKCYCCQELCPFKAVKIKKNPIIKLIGG